MEYNKEQLEGYFSRESSFNMLPPEKNISDLFNLPVTYRSKSDFPFPWGYYVKRENSYDQDIESIIKNKTKQILWLVRNCNNKRDKLAYYFQGNGLELDVYGECAERFEHQKQCESEMF